MIEQDTIKLLRECDAGVKMGVSSIDDVIDYTSDNELRGILEGSKDEHSRLDFELRGLLDRYHDDGKEPAAVAKGMAHMKTEVKLILNESDGTIADLITDGCHMGIKSLNKYLNQYTAANEDSKNIAKKIIRTEQQLAEDIAKFL